MNTNTELNVLVVEDEKLLNWSLAKALDNWGFQVRPVFTGSDALTQAQEREYDLILLDYQLPDMDGLQVARLVRKARPNVVIFLVTAFQLHELPVDAGLIDAYFNKPIDLQQLREAMAILPRWSAGTGRVGSSPLPLSRKS